MLSDMVALTKKIFDKALVDNKSLSSPKAVHHVYRSLTSLISNAELVANHYLALDLNEEFLQNSSFGEPVDKWRYFLNKDLENLNSSSKQYLHTLSSLCFEDAHEGIMSRYYNCKTYYSFVRDEYNAGYVEPCGGMLYIENLDIGVEERTHIGRFQKIDLSSFESKQIVQKVLLERIKELKIELHILKTYIKNRYTLDDLL